MTLNEIMVYLACLELGPSSIWDIAKKSGVKRTSCYTILEDMAIQGIASSTSDQRRVLYSVVSPKSLLRFVERRYDRLAGAVNELEALASKSKHKPQMRMFDGMEGIKQAYNVMLEMPKGSELLLYGSNMTLSEKLSEFIIKEFIPKRVERCFTVRSIFPDVPSGFGTVKNDIRYLPGDKFIQETQTCIIRDMVVLIAHSEDQPFATVIESADLAHDESVRFNLLWEMAKKPEERTKV